MDIIGGIFAGVTAAIAFSGWMASKELGGWKAVRDQLVVNNRLHKERRLRDK